MIKRLARAGWPVLLLGLLGVATGVGALAQSVTANWTGGNLYKRWDDPANWDKGIVPLNGNGTNYTVIVPPGVSISYLSDLTGTIDALSFGDGSVLDIAEDSQLEVTGVGVIRGTIQTDGAGSAFRAAGDGVVLEVHPRFLAKNGSTIQVASSTYSWSRFDADAELLGAETGSVIDLGNVSSLGVAGGSGARTYTIQASDGGRIDLSGLGVLTGPGSDDWLDVNLNLGGDIILDSLRQVSGQVRFNVRVPAYELPLLLRGSATKFVVGTNAGVTLPSLLSLDSGGISLQAGSRLKSESLQSVTKGSISAADGTTLDLPGLATLDSVVLSLAGSSAFIATNLSAYRNSDIPVAPERDLRIGTLTDVFGSRIVVQDGATFRIGATEYDTPAAWGWHGTLFSADGAGSLLDLSSLRTMRTRICANAYRYVVSADNNGVIDLSGLEILTGPEWSDRPLEFRVQNGGRILLPALREVQQYVQFSLDDGAVLEVPSLERLADGCWIGWGFNSEFRAPRLRSFVNSDLSLAPGQILTVPLITNVFGARFSVSGGRTFRIGATEYDTPASWRWYGTLFSADGAGSLLDLSSLLTMRTRYCDWGYRYIVSANNNGVIDLSGLERLTGPEYSDRPLEITVSSGGGVSLGDLDVSQYVAMRGSDPGSELRYHGLHLRSPVNLSVSGKARCRVRGDYTFENTDTNSIVIEGAYFQMDGTQPQRLEVGGKDLGATGSTTRNFGYSQLIVGETNQASVVRLVDSIDNGNRGAGGDPECLYLYGLDGAGLRLLNGSQLILNGLKVYALVNGQVQSLASLVAAATNSAAFGEGYVALTGGPKITNMVPAATVLPPVASVDVSFDIPIDTATFGPQDVGVVGPAGPVAVTGVSLVADNTYRIAFAAQTASGLYTVRVGPAIDELAGNLAGMDQNGDGLGGEAEADVFTSSFTIDGDAPSVVSAFGLQGGNRLGVTFNEPVAPGFATNPANYRVDGLVPASTTLRTNGTQVVLAVNPTLGSTFTLEAMGASDLLGNLSDRSFLGSILPLEPRDIGNPGSDPREPGSTVAFSPSDFDSVGGGSGVWGTSDRFHFLFERRTGDFDVRVNIARLDRTGSNSDAGIMLRETLEGNSPKVQATIEPYSGGQRFYLGIRATAGGSVSYPAGLAVADRWIRLQRQGDMFVGLRSTNGIDWIEYARLTNGFPTTAYLGFLTCADNNNAGQAVTAWFRDYSDLAPSILTQPQDQAVASGADVTFGVVAKGLAPLTYQWFHNGVALDGAADASLLLPAAQLAQVGDYTVTVSNVWGLVTSQPASLTVDNVGVDAGLEGDVAPAPLGDGVNTMQDWVKVGLFVTSLESPSNSSQFQRADAAPEPCGDGRLTVADWTMAGLYAAALIDPVQACGPKTPGAGLASVGVRGAGLAGPSPRVLRVLDGVAKKGESFEAIVELEAAGNENAVGFSLEFDPTALRFVEAIAGAGASDAVLQANGRRAVEGLVGLALAKPIGTAFSPGETQLVRVRFVPIGFEESCTVGFGDRPITREVVDTWAKVQTAQYVAGKIAVDVGPRLSGAYAAADGRFTVSFSAEQGTPWAIEASSDLVHWNELGMRTATEGLVTFTDEAAGGVNPRFYRLRQVE